MGNTLLVGQAGGATAVINSSLVGIIREARGSGRFERIWGMRRGAEGALERDLVDLTHLGEEDLGRLERTPGAALGSSRHRLSESDVETLLHFCRDHDIHALLYIGGNDSADTVHRLALHADAESYELSAIAVPKTIDNDLPVTDHSPGYGSIARYLAIATMDSAKDTESMPTMYPVKFMEVMGRNAGWVAAASTLGKLEKEDAPHLLYLPERPVSRSELVKDVERVYRMYGRVVAVLTETVRDEAGRPFADSDASQEVDAFGHPLLRGTAETMCRLVSQELGLRTRYDKPGSLQRMSSLCVSSVDRAEASEVGRAAVRLALAGHTNVMVSIVRDSNDPYSSHTTPVPLADIANRQRLLPDEFLTADGRGTTDAFRVYARPLLGPETLPDYGRLTAPAASISR
ncbi:MAG TPA: diphosphate--fructose-6-phosphate 1-phosphotransferase [Chloroflexota bacterium]